MEIPEHYKRLAAKVRQALPLTTSAEAAGLVPMANPAEGAVAWGWSRDRMRRGVIVKLGTKNAALYLTTDSAMRAATNDHAVAQSRDPEREAHVAEVQAAKRWYLRMESAKQEVEGGMHPSEVSAIEANKQWIAAHPDRNAYVTGEVVARLAEVAADKQKMVEDFARYTKASIPMSKLYEPAPIADERLPERPAVQTSRSYVSVETRPKDLPPDTQLGKDTPVTLEIVGRLHVELVVDTPHKVDVLGVGRDVGESHDWSILGSSDPVEAHKRKIWTKVMGDSDAEDPEQAKREAAENQGLVEAANPIAKLMELLQRTHDLYAIAQRTGGVGWDDFDVSCKEVVREVEGLFGFESQQSTLRARGRCSTLVNPHEQPAKYCGQAADPECRACSCTAHHLLIDASEDCCSEH
ncbi:hypothetical protein GCM10009733_021130 [Nonomuraea maheshkhaliensis]|uniref:Uncharacterized protein n=1 Tax=Nonomuraea maheshkhaliensis TaxID=419590 RepID=A0ABN2F1I3_9ACTN